MRSKLNLKDEAVAEAAEFADDAEEDEMQAEEERLPLIGAVGGRQGVLTVVGVITEDGVDAPIGVVVTAAVFVEPDHLSYFSSRARSLSSKVGSTASTVSFSLSEISSTSLVSERGGNGGGDFGGGTLFAIGVGAS